MAWYAAGSAADLCKAAMIQVERALAATDLQARFDTDLDLI